MKAISLWQPWASALFTPLKTIETRRKPVLSIIGQRVAIHAAKKRNGEVIDFWNAMDGRERDRFADIGIYRFEQLPFGCLIGTIDITGCVETEESGVLPGSDEYEWGNYGPNRFAWLTKNPVLFEKPIPCLARQGWFNVEVPDAA